MKSRKVLILAFFAVFNLGYSENFFDIFNDTVYKIDAVVSEDNFAEMLGRGNTELSRGDFQRALYYFQKADRLMSGDKEVGLGLARSYRGIGEYKRSVELLKELYRKYKDEDMYYEWLLSNEKVYESTKIDWKKELLKKEFLENFEEYLVRTAYSDSDAIYHLGNIYVKEASFEKALKVFEKDEKENLKNLFGAATTARVLGNYSKSIEYYTKLIDKHRNFHEAYLGRGMSYKMSGNFENALDDFRVYLKFKKTENLYMAMARMYLSRGLTNSAREILEEGTKYFPNSKGIRELLIETYLKLGR